MPFNIPAKAGISNFKTRTLFNSDGRGKKKILDSLKRIEGQIRGIHDMEINNHYCKDVLTQLSSLSSAINRVKDIILRRHLDSCVSAAIKKSGKELHKKEKLDEVMDFLSKFRK